MKKFISSKDVISLAAFCYQTYPLYLNGSLVLPKGYELRYVIRAFADVENPIENIYGFLAESKDNIIIAFRGYAAYPSDLLASYDIFQIPYPYIQNGGKTSRGFTCLYQSARNKLMEELNKLSPSRKLFITGHNYGGALSVLAALDIAVNSKYKKPFVYTYGSPRIGDPEFAMKFDQKVKNSIRVVNIHDSFPTYPEESYPPPFTKEGIFYHHVQKEYRLSFQLNNTTRNDSINCYFKALSKLNPDFANSLCSENPGFCPNTEGCVPFQRKC